MACRERVGARRRVNHRSSWSAHGRAAAVLPRPLGRRPARPGWRRGSPEAVALDPQTAATA
eukprot:2251102-Alexandrium_andersonii.AAC.1